MFITVATEATILDLDTPLAHKSIQQLGDAALYVPGDVRSEADASAVIAPKPHPPRIVVNCTAGGAGRFRLRGAP